MGEKISKLCSWQGINLQNVQIAPVAQLKKKKKPKKKTGRRPK